MSVDWILEDVRVPGPTGWESVELRFGGGRVQVRSGPPHDAETPPGAKRVHGRGRRLVPGLVDLHVHGFGGHDITTGGAAATLGAAEALARHGTTRFLATLYPTPPEPTFAAVQGVALAMQRQRDEGGVGARIEGVHLEGPFVNPARRGALPAACLRLPDLAEMRGLVRSFPGVIRRVTLAPEMSGAADLIRFLLDEGIRPSLGHSDCTCVEAERAAGLGPLAVTHLFNAMRGIHHREPGLALAALRHPDLVPELIADGVHVAPEVLAWVRELRGDKGLVLVSDALWPAGTALTSFEAGGEKIRQGRDAMWAEAGYLAGARLSLLEIVRDRVAEGTFELCEALSFASSWPARELGWTQDLSVGAPADAVLLDEGLAVAGVWVAGRPAVEAAS